MMAGSEASLEWYAEWGTYTSVWKRERGSGETGRSVPVFCPSAASHPSRGPWSFLPGEGWVSLDGGLPLPCLLESDCWAQS
jgi:hypothetical protein